MQQYDISLKLLLRGSGSAVLRGITGGATVQRWLDVELPEVRNTRVNRLGETAVGDGTADGGVLPEGLPPV